MSAEVKRVTLRWTRDLVFRGEAAGHEVIVDGDNAAAPGPMLHLLLAVASCTASDVVLILGKMRVPPREFRVDVAGTRREEEPRRYTAVHLDYRIVGDGIDEPRARRAIGLSLEKYCSVIHSLAPDIRVTYGLALG
jgi:putative redox protein